MPYGSTTGGGQCDSNVPDTCNTPSSSGTTPISYSNSAQVSGATGTSSKVKFDNRDVVHINSSISSSSGDEAGTSGGVVSGVNMSKCTFKVGSSVVLVEGYQCVYHTGASLHNGSSNNTTGQQSTQSQSKVSVGY